MKPWYTSLAADGAPRSKNASTNPFGLYLIEAQNLTPDCNFYIDTQLTLLHHTAEVPAAIINVKTCD